jgi:hypothetical protein
MRLRRNHCIEESEPEEGYQDDYRFRVLLLHQSVKPKLMILK